jgi:phosphoenolpyruvate carboxykinase (GTP)
MTNAATNNPTLLKWVADMAKLTQPDAVVWCDGSEAEKVRLTQLAVDTGILEPLNQQKRPGSYLHRSNPNDVARVEHLTFICTPTKEEAGPTNNWMAPADAYAKLGGLFEGSMRGRTMYVVPYCMGPIGSPFAKVGVELTDSVYVVLNQRIMTRMGNQALDMLGDSDDFNRGLHCTLDLTPRSASSATSRRTTPSGRAARATAATCCWARSAWRCASAATWVRRRAGSPSTCSSWASSPPTGTTSYVAAAFPSACGKTNFAMMIPPRRFDGWKIWTRGRRHRVDARGHRRPALRGEPGERLLRRGPRHQLKSNPNAMKTIQRDTIFTNVARTLDGDVWWEEMDGEVPDELIDWQGRPWKKGSTEKAAHPNSRFTAPASNNPMPEPRVQQPRGRAHQRHHLRRAPRHHHPARAAELQLGARRVPGRHAGSETTAAATGKVGVVRRDPMAMLPFCGYNMGDYFAHWLACSHEIESPPKLFMVNWFRKDDNGKFLWPGYGENMRVLKWVLDRAHGRIGGRETPIGWVPREGDIDLSGLDLDPERFDQATAVSTDEWIADIEAQQEFFDKIGDSMPKALVKQRELLLESLRTAPPARAK